MIYYPYPVFLSPKNNGNKPSNNCITQKTYQYDADNQLIRAYTYGVFQEDTATPGQAGKITNDYFGLSYLDFTVDQHAVVRLDYASTSIGLDFGREASRIKQIVLTPDPEHKTHRITERTLDLFISGDNTTYSIIPREKWSFQKDDSGVITLTLEETIQARYIKIHVRFDDRGLDRLPIDKAQFLNELAKTIKVYQEATARSEEYQYDADGNRRVLTLEMVQTIIYQSQYYTNSHRLKTDGKYAYKYDEAGNLVAKGNSFDIVGDTVTFTTSREEVEYWEYKYDLLNRLIQVTKNGTIMAEYGYDPEGYRVVKRAHNETTHYIFEGTEPVFEKNVTKGKAKSYVYALGKHLARVDGVIGDTEAEIYFYHTDHIGSVRAVTNQAGEVVWNADYLAFGTRFGDDGASEFEEWHGFTGIDSLEGKIKESPKDPSGETNLEVLEDGASTTESINAEKISGVIAKSEGEVTKDTPPPSKSGYKEPKGGPKKGKTKDGKTGWIDKNGNVWVPVPDGSPLAHGGGHWDVHNPKGGYDNVYPNGYVRKGSGPRGTLSPSGARISQEGLEEATIGATIVAGVIVAAKIAANIMSIFYTGQPCPGL